VLDRIFKAENLNFTVMKNRQIFLLAIGVSDFTIQKGTHLKIVICGEKVFSSCKIKTQVNQLDTSNIIFLIPPIKCGNIKWKDSTISNWLKNYCSDKCSDSLSSGYKFSGLLKKFDRRWNMKVTIKTDKEYAQPVKFDTVTGKFNGKLYFDKFNRLETVIKIMLRDSDNTVKNNYVVTLIE